jgi:hypothetical protein
MEEQKIITRVISHKQIGYTADLKTSYFEDSVEFTDGTTGTVWGTVSYDDNGEATPGPILYQRPNIGKPA